MSCLKIWIIPSPDCSHGCRLIEKKWNIQTWYLLNDMFIIQHIFFTVSLLSLISNMYLMKKKKPDNFCKPPCRLATEDISYLYDSNSDGHLIHVYPIKKCNFFSKEDRVYKNWLFHVIVYLISCIRLCRVLKVGVWSSWTIPNKIIQLILFYN